MQCIYELAYFCHEQEDYSVAQKFNFIKVTV